LPLYNAGYNVFQLTDLQIINRTANFLAYSANIDDKFANLSLDLNFHTSDLVQELQEQLNDLKLRIVENPAQVVPDYLGFPEHYINSEKIKTDLAENSINNIMDVISDKGEVHNILHLQEGLNLKEWDVRQRNMLKSEICGDADATKVLPHILKLNNAIPPIQINNFRFTYDNYDDVSGYEVFVDESLKDGIATFGIFYKNNNRHNYCDKVVGEQSLQNATYQGIAHVLHTFPTDEPLIIYLDRESVLKILWKFPLNYKQKLIAHNVDMIELIEHLLSKRTAPTYWKQVYSHLTITADTPENRIDTINTHIEIMQMWYGETRASRLIDGNNQADKLTEKAYDKSPLKAPLVNLFYNEYLLKSTRQKRTKVSDFKGYINERIRPNLKKIIRKEYARKIFKQEKYIQSQWYDNPLVSKDSWLILKSKATDHESSKKQMTRLLHDALPNKKKIYSHLLSEQIDNEENFTNKNFWQNKYGDKIVDDMCTLCGQTTETNDHLFCHCTHTKATNARDALPRKICEEISKYTADRIYNFDIWYECSYTNIQELEGFDPAWGSQGLVPKFLRNKLIQLGIKENKINELIANLQHIVIQASLEVWYARNKKLHVHNHS